MAFDERSGLEAPCPFRMCREGKMCPHAVQVALATGSVGMPGENESATAQNDVILTWDAASHALVGLG